MNFYVYTINNNSVPFQTGFYRIVKHFMRLGLHSCFWNRNFSFHFFSICEKIKCSPGPKTCKIIARFWPGLGAAEPVSSLFSTTRRVDLSRVYCVTGKMRSYFDKRVEKYALFKEILISTNCCLRLSPLSTNRFV